MSNQIGVHAIANPAPLGLLGFGMTTILLNLHNAGFTELNATIAAMGFALGGAAQIIAGIMEFLKNNTFGATAFTSYGFFWWSLVAIWLNPFGGKVADATEIDMGWYLLLWGIYTAFMFVGTLKHNRITQIVFGSLALLFFLLSAGDFLANHAIKQLAGYVGIFCGGSAIYSAMGQVLKQEYEKEVLPM